MQIHISRLLQKPTDLDLHCLQRQGISGLSRTRFEYLDIVMNQLSGIIFYMKKTIRVCHFKFVCTQIVRKALYRHQFILNIRTDRLDRPGSYACEHFETFTLPAVLKHIYKSKMDLSKIEDKYNGEEIC